MDKEELLRKVKLRLEKAYGKRLDRIVLFGSQARGDSARDSDVDIMILLKGNIEYGKELRKCIHAIYPLILETGRPINPVIADPDEYEAAEWPLYKSVRKEGITA